MATMRSRATTLRDASLAWLACIVGLVVLLPCCGEAQKPNRLKLVGRGLSWQSASRDEPTHPDAPAASGQPGSLALRWQPGQLGDVSWRVIPPPPSDKAGALVIEGPFGAAIDTELHHVLTLTLGGPQPDTLSVAWRGAGQEFSAEREQPPAAMQSDGKTQTYAWRLSGLRGQDDAADADEGIERLRIVLRGQTVPEVRDVALLTDYEANDGSGVVSTRLRKHYASCDGLALTAPGTAVAAVGEDGSDRLRLLLSAVGGPAPVTAQLTVGDTTTSIVCSPAEPWREVELLLPGAPAELQVNATCDDPRAVLLVGRVLRLAPSADDDPRPNVVLYIEDTLRADRLGTYGYERNTDPHLAALAAEGVVFENVLASSNWTRPSVASLMTSLSPPAHGNRTYRDRTPAELTTLAEAFGSAGWLTVSLTSNYHAGSWAGLDQGYDLHHEPEAFGLPLPPSTRTAERLQPFVERLFETHGDLPVLVMMHSLDPHTPYAPDPVDLERVLAGERALQGEGPAARAQRYDGEIAGNDRWIGQLDEFLSGRQLSERTLVAFVSDHGEAFGEHDAWEHHDKLYQQELAVPWVLRWPGHLPAGRRVSGTVSHVDVAPTLAGLAGVTIPVGWRGRDHSALLLGTDRSASSFRDDANTGAAASPETLAVRAVPLLAEGVRLPNQGGARHLLAVLLDPYKLILEVRNGELRPQGLFDLAADPGEQQNLLGRADQTERIASLTAFAQEQLDAGPVASGDREAEGLDPAKRAWMEAMGYLR